MHHCACAHKNPPDLTGQDGRDENWRILVCQWLHTGCPGDSRDSRALKGTGPPRHLACGLLSKFTVWHNSGVTFLQAGASPFRVRAFACGPETRGSRCATSGSGPKLSPPPLSLPSSVRGSFGQCVPQILKHDEKPFLPPLLKRISRLTVLEC